MNSAYEAALCLVLVAVFLTSGLPKLRSPARFLLVVLDYDVLTPRLGRAYAVVVPVLEVLVALLLLAGVAVRAACIVAALLFASFATGIAVNLGRGRIIDCGCFGRGHHRTIGPGVLAQDIALVCLACTAAVLAASWFAPEPWSVARASTPIGGTVTTPVAICVRPLGYAACQAVAHRYAGNEVARISRPA